MKIPNPVNLVWEEQKSDWVTYGYSEGFGSDAIKWYRHACYMGMYSEIRRGVPVYIQKEKTFYLKSEHTYSPTKKEFFRFMSRARRAGFIPKYFTFDYTAQKEEEEDKGGYLKGIFDAQHPDYLKADAYVALCLFRWSDSSPSLITNTLKVLDEIKGTSFIQAFFYCFAYYKLKNWNHSFMFSPKTMKKEYSFNASSFLAFVSYLGLDYKEKVRFLKGSELNFRLRDRFKDAYYVPAKYPKEILLTKRFRRLLSPKYTTPERIEKAVADGILKVAEKGSDYRSCY